MKKSKISKIQILSKGMALILSCMFMLTPIAYASTSLDDSGYLESSIWDKLLYGEIGSTVNAIEEYLKTNATLYIKNETHLRAFAEYVNKGNDCKGKVIALLNDVKIESSEEWTSIGNGININFKGTFKGNNYQISGLTDSLFGYVGEVNSDANPEISGVILNNIAIDVTFEKAGAIARIIYNGEISECKVIGEIVGESKVGGIVGSAINSVIKNCTNEASVIGSSDVGGIVGYIEEIKENTRENIISCKNIGSISGKSLNSLNIGGIVGFANQAKISKCFNNGSVSGNGENNTYGEYIGGIVGKANDAYILNSINDTNEIRGKRFIGGIIGELFVTGTKPSGIENCINHKGMLATNADYTEQDNTQLNTNKELIGGIAGNISAGSNEIIQVGHQIYDNLTLANNAYYHMWSETEYNFTNSLFFNLQSIFKKVHDDGHNIWHEYDDNNNENNDEECQICWREWLSILNGAHSSDMDFSYPFNEQDVEKDDQITVLQIYQLINGVNYGLTNCWENESKTLQYTIVGAYGANTFMYNGTKGIGIIKGANDILDKLTLNNAAQLIVGESADESKLYAFYNDYKNIGIDSTSLFENEVYNIYITEGSQKTHKQFIKVKGKEITYTADEGIGFTEEKEAKKEVIFTTGDRNNVTLKYQLYKNDTSTPIMDKQGYKAGDKILVQAIFDKVIYSKFTLQDGQTIGTALDKTMAPYLDLTYKLIDGTEKTIRLGVDSQKGIEIIKIPALQNTYTFINYTLDITEDIENGQITKVSLKNNNVLPNGYYYAGTTTGTFLINEETTPMDLSGRKITIDTKKPSLNTDVYVEEALENGRYTAGKEVLIKVQSSEEIKDMDAPAIKVSFSKSGEGKYNYTNGKAGYAKCIGSSININDAATIWVYSYQIQEGDEGDMKITYDDDGDGVTITDLAENETIISKSNNNNEVSVDKIYADTTAPTVEISVKDTEKDITNKDNFEVEFKWSEKVIGFEEKDITVNNGKKGTLSDPVENEDGTYSYTMDISTYVASGNMGELQIMVEANACQDLVALGNVRTEKIITVDKIAPIFIGLEAYTESGIKLNENVDVIKEYYKAGDKIKVVARFNENVSEDAKTSTKLSLQFSESGNAGNINIDDISVEGNKIIYTYTIEDNDLGKLSVKAYSGEVKDIAGNATEVTRKTLDGNTIIVDTVDPELEELKVFTDKEDVKAGDDIIIEAIFDEEIYALENGEIKLITKDNANKYAPELKLTFGGKDAKGTVKAIGYGEKDGKEDRTKIKYSYTITDGDTGELKITTNKDNISVVDISGNNALSKVEQTGDSVLADTRKPEVTAITAEGHSDIENIVHNNVGYYKSGSTIDVTVKSDEIIATDVIEVWYAFKDSEPSSSEYTKNLVGHLNVNDNKEFNFTIEVKDNQNGYLWVKINDSVFADKAGNRNLEEAAVKVSNIYADTTDPYLTTNSNGISQLEIEELKNSEGQITGIEAIGIFSEKVFSIQNNGLIELKDIPEAGIFVNGEKNKELTFKGKDEVDGKTKLTYRTDITDIDTTGIIKVGFIGGKVYDRAGNEYSTQLNEGDASSPIFKDIKVITDNGFYKAGDVIEILARFEEKTKLTKVPKLTIKIGDKIVEIKDGIYSQEDSIDKDIKVAKYTYEILDGDNGPINVVSLIGEVSDGVRENNISKIYIDNDTDDVNTESKELLNSIGSEYSNNDEEYKNVFADNIAPTLIITADAEKTNKHEITYTFTWSEIVTDFTKSDINIINGVKGEFKQADELGKVYTLVVDSTEEGRQIIKIAEGICQDRAGNLNSERLTYNDVVIDFTKPIIRAKVNGGNYVIDTDTNKSTFKEIVVVSEELSKFEYAWSTSEDINSITSWETIDVTGIIANSDITLEKSVNEGKYYLYIKVTDLAGNTKVAKTNAFDVAEKEIKLQPNTTVATNKDIIVTVLYGDSLTENRKAGISGKTQSADPSKIIISENGIIYAEATDKAGNRVYTSVNIENIDKTMPEATISYQTNEDGSITATISFNEDDVTITNNSGEESYTFTQNGEFTFEFKDKAGNVGTAKAVVNEIDKTAPSIMFKYTSTIATLGNPIGATVITNEDAKISYSWDNAKWTTSEEYIKALQIVDTKRDIGNYTLYAKAEDKNGNISEIQILEFKVVKEEEIAVPEIIFEGLPVLQINRVKYVKIPENMTAEILTSKINQAALCGETPEYINLTDNGDLRTGSKVTLNGEVKYIIAVNGDVNCDGKVTFIDIIKANGIRISNSEDTLLKEQLLAADINNTNRIEFRDIISINALRINSLNN